MISRDGDATLLPFYVRTPQPHSCIAMPTGSSSGKSTKSLGELLNADYVNELCVSDVQSRTIARGLDRRPQTHGDVCSFPGHER